METTGLKPGLTIDRSRPSGIQIYTRLDEQAEHQIRIVSPGASYLYASCTCLKRKWIAKITTIAEAWTAYNDYHKEIVI
jgi:hypothetical protein